MFLVLSSMARICVNFKSVDEYLDQSLELIVELYVDVVTGRRKPSRQLKHLVCDLKLA